MIIIIILSDLVDDLDQKLRYSYTIYGIGILLINILSEFSSKVVRVQIKCLPL